MAKTQWWAWCGMALWAGVWAALAWITLDPGLQGTEDALGPWMFPIAVAPVMLLGLGGMISERGAPGDGGAAYASGTDCGPAGPGAGGCGGGCGGCGGCGG
ncbi:hypothetical protein ABZW32_34605 [Streptomyces sp. NPDC004667]|uniref:hypothetical protein n=1 Tax=Streptomyces sp. NPDC004667 TaxID=3154285 RepID=UPI0033A23908